MRHGAPVLVGVEVSAPEVAVQARRGSVGTDEVAEAREQALEAATHAGARASLGDGALELRSEALRFVEFGPASAERGSIAGASR